MATKTNNLVISETGLKNKIYEIRGQKVMLDYDLAEIYGYTTKAFNQQVARNIEKFEGEDFMFQLTEVEFANLKSKNLTSSWNDREQILRSKYLTSKQEENFLRCQNGTLKEVSISRSQNVTLKQNSEEQILMCKNCTSSDADENLKSQNVTSSWGGTRKMPYAFTEQGIYMLMTVLRGELAVKQSRALIRLFKTMKDYIIENQERLDYRSNLEIAMKVAENTQDMEVVKGELGKLDTEMRKMNKKLGDAVMKADLPVIFNRIVEQREFILLNGQLMRASETYIDIYARAKKSIHIIDNYVSIKTLRHLQKVKPGVEVVIFSDNKGNYLHKSDYIDFKKEFPKLKVKFVKNEGLIHDRFIILDYNTRDETIYHCGASAKDAGGKMTAIGVFDDDFVKKVVREVVERLMGNGDLRLR